MSMVPENFRKLTYYETVQISVIGTYALVQVLSRILQALRDVLEEQNDEDNE